MRTYPVIVGADGTDSSKTAVRRAAREAYRRNLPLRVVHVFDWDWREARYDTSNEYPDESAASALVEASSRAQLVVVGSRGRGRITGTLLGSAGLQLLHHAECPVYIARTPEGERGRQEVPHDHLDPAEG